MTHQEDQLTRDATPGRPPAALATPSRRRRRARAIGPPDPEDIGFGRRFVAATSFGSVLNPVNSSIIAVALVPIGQAFGVGTSATTWLVSALYLATAIGQPTMGRLADLVGPRRVYLAGTAAGMLRTFMYVGAIASASLISLSFGHAATDASLHRLAAILTIAAAALLAATLADRELASS